MTELPDPNDLDAIREYVERVPFEEFARDHLFPIFDAAVAFGLTRDQVYEVGMRAVRAGPPEEVHDRVIDALADEIERST